MKKLLLLFSVLMLTISATAQNVTIPDANFKAYLVGSASVNTNGDSEIQLSEASAFTGIIWCESLGITDMTGIEFFTNITGLRCGGNGITSLDLTTNTSLGGTMRCENNALSSLILPPTNNITEIYCYGNQLTSIDLSVVPNLTLFHGVGNNFASLDVSANTALQNLNFGESPLTSIDLTGLTNLQILYCTASGLTSLDISPCTSLYNLGASYMFSLTELNMANGNNMSFGPNDLDVTNVPNLTCVTVDNVSFSNTAWPPYFDPGVTFSTDCNAATPLATSVAVSGPATVEVNATGQYSSVVSPANASQSVTWLVQNVTGQAAIDPNTGVLTGIATGTVEVGAMANDGSNQYGTMTVTITEAAGIKETNKQVMTIYPNPVTTTMHIQTDQIVESIRIFDLAGTLVQKELDKTFSTAQLKSGVYILNVVTESGVIQKRFVKN